VESGSFTIPFGSNPASLFAGRIDQSSRLMGLVGLAVCGEESPVGRSRIDRRWPIVVRQQHVDRGAQAG